jgi:hypothetical protein
VNRLPLASSARTVEHARASRAEAFGLMPAELKRLGVAAADATFARLQRPWLWEQGAPRVSRAARAAIPPGALV